MLYTTSLAEWLRRPPRERGTPGSIPACAGIFPGSSHTGDLKNGTPWLPCLAPGVKGSVLGLGEMESWICNFYLSVTARTIV